MKIKAKVLSFCPSVLRPELCLAIAVSVGGQIVPSRSLDAPKSETFVMNPRLAGEMCEKNTSEQSKSDARAIENFSNERKQKKKKRIIKKKKKKTERERDGVCGDRERKEDRSASAESQSPAQLMALFAKKKNSKKTKKKQQLLGRQISDYFAPQLE